MGRARNIFDLSLAGGAIIGILALMSPQLVSVESTLSSVGAAQARAPKSSVEKSSVEKGSVEKGSVEKGAVEIAHFLGIAQFVKNPTDYDVVHGEKVGNVTSAFLVGDRMTIRYSYPAKRDAAIGELKGTVNSDGVFNGDYSTESIQDSTKDGTQKRDVSFTFAADGSAKGKADSKGIDLVRTSAQ